MQTEQWTNTAENIRSLQIQARKLDCNCKVQRCRHNKHSNTHNFMVFLFSAIFWASFSSTCLSVCLWVSTLLFCQHHKEDNSEVPSSHVSIFGQRDPPPPPPPRPLQSRPIKQQRFKSCEQCNRQILDRWSVTEEEEEQALGWLLDGYLNLQTAG